MTKTDEIIALFGGLSAMARDLKHKNRTTVQGWSERDKIPAWRHIEVFSLARKKKIPRSKIAKLLDGGGR